MRKTGPTITLARKSGAAALLKRISGITKIEALVGVPSEGTKRSAQLLGMAGSARGKKLEKLKKAAAEDVDNAELLFIFSKGSPRRQQPERPVLEPSVMADGNRESVAHELAEAVKYSLAGKPEDYKKRMMRAALAGQNAARKWFTDPRNGWAPNAPATIAAKGSDRPGIDTGAMRAAIVGLLRET